MLLRSRLREEHKRAWSIAIDDPQRIFAQDEQGRDLLQHLGTYIGFPGLVRPFQGDDGQLHEIVHRNTARVRWVEDWLGEPGIDVSWSR